MPATVRRVPARLSLAVGSGSLLQPLNSSMIAVALVTIAVDLQIQSGISWLISGLYLATAVAAPTAGRLADLYGPRRIFFCGLVLVAAGGAMGPLLPTLPGLVAARIVLGLGTAAQFPCAMAIIRARARRYDEEASGALAVLSICAQVSVAFGPTLGGFLVGSLGWQAVFWINVPLTAASAAWVSRAAPPDDAVDPTRRGLAALDLPGLALFAAFLATMMLFLLTLADAVQWWWAGAAVPLGVLLVLRERRAAEPFLDVSMLTTNRRLSAVLVRQAVVSMAFYSVFYSLPQWLEGVRGYGPEQVGLLVIPIALVGIASTVTASRLISRTGFVPPLLIGSAALVLGGVLIAVALDATTPVWAFLVVAALLGIPNGFNNQANQNELYAVAAADQIGAAAGLLRTTQYIGANLSAAMLEVLFAGPVSDPGLHRVGWGIAVLATVLLTGTLLRRWTVR